MIAALVTVEEYNATALAVTTAPAPGVEYITPAPAAIAVPARVVEHIAQAHAAIAALSPVVEYFPPVIIAFVVPAFAVCAAPAVRVQWKAKDVAASHLSTAVACSRDIAASPPF